MQDVSNDSRKKNTKRYKYYYLSTIRMKVLFLFVFSAGYTQYYVLRKFLIVTKESNCTNNLQLASSLVAKEKINNNHTAVSLSSQSDRTIILNRTTVLRSRKRNETKQIRHKWAYAFLVAGCSETNPGYKGFLYNTVVAVQRLKEMGSVADFIIFIQMSTTTNSQTLSIEEETMLHSLDINVRYLPKMRSHIHECFYAVVQEKFRILQLIEYSRVLFLDADIMPLCNLDYMFELSESQDKVNDHFFQFKDNIIIASNEEAANAGFFLLRPNMGDWYQLQKEIRKKEEKALTLPWPYFDPIEGWGHKISPPDYWRPVNGSKLTLWNWHAVFADQGLLYYWTKYVKKEVSIIIGNEIEQWTTNGSIGGGKVYLDEIIRSNPLKKYSCRVQDRYPPPYSDFHHFTGHRKPWQMDIFNNANKSDGGKQRSRRIDEWKMALSRVQQKTNFSFDMQNDESIPPLGRFSTSELMIRHIRAKRFFQWEQYEAMQLRTTRFIH